MSSSSNGASANGNSVPVAYDVDMTSTLELSRPIAQVLGDEMQLFMLSPHSMEVGRSSVAAPSHRIQSFHSSRPSPSLKAWSKMSESGSMRLLPLGVIMTQLLSVWRKLRLPKGILYVVWCCAVIRGDLIEAEADSIDTVGGSGSIRYTSRSLLAVADDEAWRKVGGGVF